MGISSVWPTKDATMIPRLSVTDRLNCVGAPPPHVTTVDRPSQIILVFFPWRTYCTLSLSWLAWICCLTVHRQPIKDTSPNPVPGSSLDLLGKYFIGSILSYNTVIRQCPCQGELFSRLPGIWLPVSIYYLWLTRYGEPNRSRVALVC